MVEPKGVSEAWLEVETAIGARLSEKRKAVLLDDILRWVEGKADQESVVEKARDLLEAIRETAPEPGTVRLLSGDAPHAGGRKRTPRTVTRTQVLAAAIAAIAEADPDVLAYRRRVLGGKLLRLAGVAKWLRERDREDRQGGRGVVLLVVPLPAGHEARGTPGPPVGHVPDPPVIADADHPAVALESWALEYLRPGSEWVNRLPVVPRGRLDQLRVLSNKCARQYGWHPAEASGFILAGQVPILSEVTAEYHSASSSPSGRPSITAAGRVVLTLDPMVTPEQVKLLYGRIRQRVLGPRRKEPGESALSLAAFAIERELLIGERAERGANEDDKQEWNRRHPERAYGFLHHFRRDCRNAINRLLYPVRGGPIMPAGSPAGGGKGDE